MLPSGSYDETLIPNLDKIIECRPIFAPTSNANLYFLFSKVKSKIINSLIKNVSNISVLPNLT